MLQEERIFPPPPDFAAQAHIKSFEELENLRAEATADPEAFWARMAEELHWFKKWDTVLKWDPPHAEWFVGGKINISYNCLDRHLKTWRRNKAALIWEGEPGDSAPTRISNSTPKCASSRTCSKAPALSAATASLCTCR